MKKVILLVIAVFLSTVGGSFLPSLLVSIIPMDKHVSIALVCFVLVVIFILIYIIVDKVIPNKIDDTEGNSYCVTGIVFNSTHDKVLMVFNQQQNMWIPPGTHIRKVLNVDDHLLKTIKNETGYTAHYLKYSNTKDYEDDNCRIVPCPFSVQVEKQVPGEGHEYHYDFIYILETKEPETSSNAGKQSHKWCTVEDIQRDANHHNTYQDVVQTVKAANKVLNNYVELIKKKQEQEQKPE